MSESNATETRLGALSALGVSVWLDQIARAMLNNGDLARMVAQDSLVGMTSNPSIFEKAILGSSDYDAELAELAGQGVDTEQIYEKLASDDVRAAADILRPVYDRTSGADGYVSMEVAPNLARDTAATTEAAQHIWDLVDRPNLMVKIPGTEEGLPSITESISAGLNVNVTLLFSVDAYLKVAEAYIAGLEKRAEAGQPIDGIASVASFFVSRVDTAVDPLLEELGHSELAGTAAVANAQIAYGHCSEIFASERFARLAEKGARPQRVLWASTSTKNPAYSDVKYVEELTGAGVVNTMPLDTLIAFQDHGNSADVLSGTFESAKKQFDALGEAGVSMEKVTGQLLDDGIRLFADAMNQLLAGIDQRRPK